jgi:RHS repeat-associated protein
VGQRGHFPYGETWYETNTVTKLKFTTYERDSETSVGASDGNDYAKQRYYVNRLGRFNGPDPVAGSTGTPQSLNRYTYVQNDPINSSDPSDNFVVGFLAELGDPAGFGLGAFSQRNEFDLLQVQIGTAPLYHSDSENFHFEDYTSEQLRSFAGHDEIEYLGRVPVYGSFFVQNGQATGNRGQSGDSEKRDRLTCNSAVLDMFYCLWKKGGYGNARTERSMWVTEANGSF